MAISFPYPTQGTVARPRGQGCLSCVHKKYCQAFYWYIRETDYNVTEQNGLACESWSDDPRDIVTEITADDLAENARLNNKGLLLEPNPCGLSDAVTANAHEPYM
jgi:hypothetical protein